MTTQTVSQTGVGTSSVIVLNPLNQPFSNQIAATLTGTATYSIEYSLGGTGLSGYNAATDSWDPIASLTAQSASAAITTAAPYTGVRVRITSGTGTVGLSVTNTLVTQSFYNTNPQTPSGLPQDAPAFFGTPAVSFSDGTTVSIQPSGDTSGAIDTAAINAAHAALPSYGGQITFGAGVFYFGANKITFTKSVKLVGQGSSDGFQAGGNTAITSLQWNTTTGDGVEFQGVGSSATLVHFGNVSTTIATAGRGIVLNGCHGFSLDRCSTFGFAYGGGIQNCNAHVWTNNKHFGCAIADVLINNLTTDEGDCIFSNNSFCGSGGNNGATPTANLIWKSGGGTKIVGNKFNSEPAPGTAGRPVNNILVQPGSGVVTSVFDVTGNSLEGASGTCIVLDASQGGTGSMKGFYIVSNEFGGIGLQAALTVSGTSTYQFSDIIIDNSVLLAMLGYVTLFQYCDTVYVGSMVSDTIGQVLVVGATGGSLQTTATCTNISWDMTKWVLRNKAANQAILVDYTVSATESHKRGNRNNKFVREMPAVSAVGTAYSVAQITIPIYLAAYLKVKVATSVSGIGACYVQAERYLLCNTSGVLAGTTIGTDITSANLSVSFSYSGNTVMVQVTITGAGAVNGCGDIVLELDGSIQNFNQLN